MCEKRLPPDRQCILIEQDLELRHQIIQGSKLLMDESILAKSGPSLLCSRSCGGEVLSGEF